MLFNSFEYIGLFLPLTMVGFFILRSLGLPNAIKGFLAAASLAFYGYWRPTYLLLLISSVLINYLVGCLLGCNRLGRHKWLILSSGVVFNIILLGYFKYAYFVANNFAFLSGVKVDVGVIILPLAISFFTFQQIAYLVDTYQGKTTSTDLVSYVLFVTFFPQLIAGPIVRHKEMQYQYDNMGKTPVDYGEIYAGLLLFSIGLFKKTVIADSFAVWADRGFDVLASLELTTAWITSLCFTFQLYFDFSGYTDMALGSACFFGIKLPVNFNSPYRATSIRDFWRRWNVTLSRFLRDYVYIPIGGNRLSVSRTYVNILITFLIGGLWHGAGWTFLVWGALHGIGSIAERFLKRLGLWVPKWLGWFITFNFVNMCWVFFRARDFEQAFKVIRGMLGLNGISWEKLSELCAVKSGLSMLEGGLLNQLAARELLSIGVNFATELPILLIIVCAAVSFFAGNSTQMAFRPTPKVGMVLLASVLFVVGALALCSEIPGKFIYFEF